MNKHRPLKILICTGIFPPDSGGPATYAKTIAEALSLRGHAVKVLTYVSRELETTFYPVYTVTRNIHILARYFAYFISVLWYGKSCDVLFVLDTVSAGYPTYSANKILRKIMVVRVVGDHAWQEAVNKGLTSETPDSFQTASFEDKKINALRRIQSKVVRCANYIILPSAQFKEIVSLWGVNEEKMRVIYNAVNVPNLLPPKSEIRKKYSLKPREFIVLSAGRDIHSKGFTALKDAVQGIDDSSLRLIILTEATHDALLENMRAADIFVLNTAYENFSFSILEALALGTPVVTTPAGGNLEVIDDGVNGIFVPFNDKEAIKDAILRLKRDAGLRKKLSKAGIETSKKYTVQRMADETEKLLEELRK